MDAEQTESGSIRSRLEALGWKKADIEDALDISHEYQSQPEVSKVWIYGSMARGTFDRKATPSDMDISIEKDSLPSSLWETDRRVGKEGRQIQIQIFRAGYDEETAALSKTDLDRTLAFQAKSRLHDQIVLWQRKT